MAVTWNASDSTTGMAVSGAGLIATATSSLTDEAIRANTALSGKQYFEVVISGANLYSSLAFSNLSFSLASTPPSPPYYMSTNAFGYELDDGGIYYNNGTPTQTIQTTAAAQVLRCAVDLPNNKVWFSTAGGNWNNSGTANPATNTGGITIPISGTIYPMVVIADYSGTTMAFTLKALSSSWTYSAPSGFSAYDPGSGVTGTLAATEAKDAAAISGVLGYSGTLAATEAADVAAISGTVAGISGTLAATEAKDAAAISGVLGYSGTLAANEAKDAAAVAGILGYSGTLAATEAADVSSISGSVSASGVTGSLAATEARDTAAISGVLAYSGTLAATEAKDVASITGALVIPITGALAATEARDSASILITFFGGWTPIPPTDETWVPIPVNDETWTPVSGSAVNWS